MAAAPPAVGPPALVAVPPGPPSWRELYDSADHIFSAPTIPYALLLAAFFRSVDPPETLLMKLERTSLELPVMIALVSDEALDSISLVLKNPCRYIGSLLNPSVLDGLVYASENTFMPFHQKVCSFFHIYVLFSYFPLSYLINFLFRS